MPTRTLKENDCSPRMVTNVSQ